MQETVLMETLVEEGQAHLFAGWPASGEGDADKRRLLAQLQHLDANYAGGLCKYIQNARKLLRDSKEGESAGPGPGAVGGAGRPPAAAACWPLFAANRGRLPSPPPVCPCRRQPIRRLRAVGARGGEA